MTYRLVLLLAALALALAGCGDDGDSGNGDNGGQPAASGGSGGSGGGGEPPGNLDAAQQNAYDAAEVACGEPPVEETAKQLGLPPSSTEQEIADYYGEVLSTGDVQQASSDGCLAGLKQAPGG